MSRGSFVLLILSLAKVSNILSGVNCLSNCFITPNLHDSKEKPVFLKKVSFPSIVFPSDFSFILKEVHSLRVRENFENFVSVEMISGLLFSFQNWFSIGNRPLSFRKISRMFLMTTGFVIKLCIDPFKGVFVFLIYLFEYGSNSLASSEMWENFALRYSIESAKPLLRVFTLGKIVQKLVFIAVFSPLSPLSNSYLHNTKLSIKGPFSLSFLGI